MNRSPPHPRMDVPIEMATYSMLREASANTGYQKEIWEIAAEAFRDWLVRNSPDSFALPKTTGFQWKDVFLPTGTMLRTVFQGKNYHCIVEADHLQYQGKEISPSGFANGVGGAGRNAWKVIWVLLPDTTIWRLASALRQSKPRRAK
jgi:hypothetical protein